jgi:NAD(P)-dependent dehydrogenase (short-subunit alcohol dehydrogenase family)
MTGDAVRRFTGCRVLVTGASRGIGSMVAADLAQRGARLILVARHEEAIRAHAASLPNGPHDVVALDVSDTKAWREAQGTLQSGGVVNGVVTAAAALTPVGPPGAWDAVAFRETLETNVTGTLLAVLSVLDQLRSSNGAVVTFSGGGATGPFPRFHAYAASKAAVVRLTENLAIDLAADGVRVNAVAPGLIATTMHDATLDAGADLVGPAYYERTQRAVTGGQGDPAEPVIELVAYLLSAQAAGITGKLLSAQWDPWREDDFQERLRQDRDLATLRRIDDQFFAAKELGQ